MTFQRLLFSVTVILLSACAQVMPPQPNDPYYAPVVPGYEIAQNMQMQTGAIYSHTNASFLYSIVPPQE